MYCKIATLLWRFDQRSSCKLVTRTLLVGTLGQVRAYVLMLVQIITGTFVPKQESGLL